MEDLVKVRMLEGALQGTDIWCGDFNSLNSLWGSNGTDGQVEEFTDIHSLVCINKEGTR